MRTVTRVICVLLIAVAWNASAADDGQTQPRLSNNSLNSPNTSVDIVGTTNGSGNVKGVQCQNTAGTVINVNIYVNGGSAQTLRIDTSLPMDSNNNTGWIPMNVRFSSSIRVQMQRPASPVIYGQTICVVSWALD